MVATSATRSAGRVTRRMRAVWPGLVATLMMGFGPAVGSADGNEAAAAEQVRAASRAFSAALVAGDLAALGEAYTEDARVLPPGRVVQGREAIRRYFTLPPQRQQVAHEMRSDDLVIDGDIAIDSGVWTSTVRSGDDEPVTHSERYLAIWRRGDDGRWRMQFDMWHRAPPKTGG